MRIAPEINLFLYALIAILMVLAGCASLFLRGKTQNGIYTAPAGLFSCQIPSSSDVKVQDWDNEENTYIMTGGVSFVSWFGICRIDYIAAHDAPVQDELNRMLSTQMNWYRKIPCTNVYVLHQEADGERMFAVLVAPKGELGSFTFTGDPQKPEHPDLSRSMLIFKHGYYIYAASTSADDRPGIKSDDVSAERISWLHQKVTEFADSIKFTPPEATK